MSKKEILSQDDWEKQLEWRLLNVVWTDKHGIRHALWNKSVAQNYNIVKYEYYNWILENRKELLEL
tara:strand:+ start:114 stop:311 length:198 start_codon:yes stop_codon:yes gene_type:complete